ncbi:MAG TPA: hypothetical protein VM094_07750 [Gemmatimonadales bacterium]|nr:hypothetical protein [Gemmatimonadales bacterium]
MIPRLALPAILAAALVVAQGCNSRSAGPTDPSSSSGLKPVNPSQEDVCLDPEGNPLPVAPESLRVDLGKPTFSDPTNVTNQLFPIGTLFRAVFYGKVEGASLRLETTLLSETRTLDVEGQPVETLISQFVAWVDGRIHEVAIDHYAQADDGSVWYFGEDVFNYEDGAVGDTEGTWLAGRDGPAAMIMPANPKVGDVWRPENICGLVFEEVTATATGLTVETAHGPVTGGLAIQELHMDGVLEDKTFAPGYGEWTSGSGDDLEALVLAVPADALPGLPPKELETLSAGAAEIFDLAQAEDWESAAATAAGMTEAWDAFKAGGVPAMVEAELQGSLDALVAAIEAQDVEEARQATLRVALPTLDLKLRHRTAAETDLDLLDVWARQLVLDAAAGDQNAVIGDAATLGWIRDRVARDVPLPELRALDERLAGLRSAAAMRNLSAAGAAAVSLRATVARTHVIGRRH